MVGTTGFEPATSRTPSVRATRLRYVPTEGQLTPLGRRQQYNLSKMAETAVGFKSTRSSHPQRLSLSPAFEKGQEAAERVA